MGEYTPLTQLGFTKHQLTPDEVAILRNNARISRGDSLVATTVAQSGHPGGSMSSLDILTLLYSCATVSPHRTKDPARDRIVVSNGHISPGVYSVLGRNGFFQSAGLSVDDLLAHFRQGGSPFTGHVERVIPGVEWDTGNLGQGKSAGVGFAYVAWLRRLPTTVYVLTGDGEQEKGQIREAADMAAKLHREGRLNKLIVTVDYNGKQISGDVTRLSPTTSAANLRKKYEASDWSVIDVDGHDVEAIYGAYRRAHAIDGPVAVIAKTVMGKGVPAMEDDHQWHGKGLKHDDPGARIDCRRALEILGLPDPVPAATARRSQALRPIPEESRRGARLELRPGDPITYPIDEKKHGCREAFGRTLLDLGKRNPRAVVALNADLTESNNMHLFAEAFPDQFIDAGIQEHNVATVAGAISSEAVVTFMSTFTIFGLVEALNQQRLNGLNDATLKLCLTHTGANLGQDGKTHHPLEYLGILRSLKGWEAYLPADPNQTDRIVRYVAQQWGNDAVLMPRTTTPVITREDGTPAFAGDYAFRPGTDEWIRDGTHGAIVTYGALLSRALKIRERLAAGGLRLAVVNKPQPLHIDPASTQRLASLPLLLTYEDHYVESGVGTTLANHFTGDAAGAALWRDRAKAGLPMQIARFGFHHPNSSGPPEELYELAGLGIDATAKRIREFATAAGVP